MTFSIHWFPVRLASLGLLKFQCGHFLFEMFGFFWMFFESLSFFKHFDCFSINIIVTAFLEESENVHFLKTSLGV